jgi:hypothetical protein
MKITYKEFLSGLAIALVVAIGITAFGTWVARGASECPVTYCDETEIEANR